MALFFNLSMNMKAGFNRRISTAQLLLLTVLITWSSAVHSQQTKTIDSSSPYFRTVVAGAEYGTSEKHQRLWGRDWRREWTAPVVIPVLNLDSAYGGLTPFKKGGGRQTQSLHVKDAAGRRWVFRSVNKTYTKALPEIARGTFIETIANDQIATNNPYAALTVAPMAEAAGVYHTNPRYYVLPNSPRLGQWRDSFANMLILFEEHPDDTQVGVASFGHPEDIQSTEKILEKVREENDHFVDQNSFLKTRLFDMFVGDWGRHPDNWRWAKFDKGSYKIYRPVPKDRDQVFAKYEGSVLSAIISGAGLKQLQTFDDHIKDIRWYNWPGSPLDQEFLNGLSRQTWIDSAKALQNSLTDDVIEDAVAQMPPPVFAISGQEIIHDLKTRRDDLVKYAGDYYKFLAKNVTIPGSEQNEVFEINRLNDSITSVNIYRVNKHGEVKPKPTFSRIFFSGETEELRIYGIGGHDVYRVYGSGNNGIEIRIIGGTGKDSLINHSSKIKYYDNPGNYISGPVNAHLSADTGINALDIEKIKFDKAGFVLMPNYANTRGVFLQAGYKITKQQWRKQPFGWEQSLKLYYSISNNSVGADYKGIFNEVIGKWNILLNASYDQVLKNYFFGLGNETPNLKTIKYYQLHTNEVIGSLGLNRVFGNNSFTASGFFQSIKAKSETDHLTSETLPAIDASVFDRKNFVGGLVNYQYYYVNDLVVPTKGFGFSLNGSHTQNLTQRDRGFQRYWTTMGFYLPLGGDFSFATRNGVATLTGDPEFYQYNWLGGGQNLRGFHRQRFYGKTSFYNNNELRWIPNIKSYLFNGKVGLIGFIDDGRVWMPHEDSNKWHVGYGAGLLVSPFNKLAATVYFGMSEDDRLVHIRLGKFF